jgi:hypothetical protein
VSPDISNFYDLAIMKEKSEGIEKQHFCNESLTCYTQMKNAFNNQLYGMSVFKGIEEVEPSALELKTLKNGLLETIVEGRNSNAGFFRLLNVRMSLFTYCNIEILMDTKVS